MSVEAEMQELRSKQQTLDHALQELMKVVAGTHEVVTLILKDQLEMRQEMRTELVEIKAFMKQKNKRSDTTEELLIQIVNNLASK